MTPSSASMREPRVGAQELEAVEAEQGEVAEQHAGEQLAEHRRLAQALGCPAAELGADEDHEQADEDGRDRIGMAGAVAAGGDPARRRSRR